MSMLVACSNKEYEEAMDEGMESIENENFEEAADYFKLALDEKEDDEEATSLLKETELYVDGEDALMDGNLDEANVLFDSIGKEEESLSELKESADQKLEEIENLKKKEEKIDKDLEEAKEKGETGNYEEALSILKEGLEEDLSHDYFQEKEEDLESLKESMSEYKGVKEEASKSINEAEEIQEEEDFEEALSIIEQALEEDYEHLGLSDSKEKLIELKKDIKSKEKAQQKQDSIEGYWVDDTLEDEPGTEIIKITSDEFMVVIMGSDTMAYFEINSLEIDDDSGEGEINTTDNNMDISDLEEDKMVLEDTEYYKVSEEKVENIIGDTMTVDELFDPEKIKKAEETFGT